MNSDAPLIVAEIGVIIIVVAVIGAFTLNTRYNPHDPNKRAIDVIAQGQVFYSRQNQAERQKLLELVEALVQNCSIVTTPESIGGTS